MLHATIESKIKFDQFSLSIVNNAPEEFIGILVLGFLDPPEMIDSLRQVNGFPHNFSQTGEFVFEVDVLGAFLHVLLVDFGEGGHLG